MPKLKTPFEEMFWRKVDKNGSTPEGFSDPCWLWKAAIQKKRGYAVVTRNLIQYYAHRISYELERGPIPNGLQLDHLCRVKHCVNPSHLEPVTGRTNVLRGTSFSAINAKKTHCPLGHKLSGDNLMISSGKRRCLICHRTQSRESMRRLWKRKRMCA